MVASLLLSGCAAIPMTDTAERQLSDRVKSHLDDVDGFRATQETTVVDGNQTRTTTAEVSVNFTSGAMRTETLAPEERAGDVVLTNSSMTLFYDESENRATRMDSGAGTGVSRQSLDEVVDRLASSYDADYRGEATVAGEQTYVVDLSPANDSVTGEMTVWLDTETYFPRQTRQTMSPGNDTITTTTTDTNVTINPEFDAGTFAFDLPEDATVTEPRFDSNSADSRAELTEMVASVPDPTVPDGFQFESGTAVDSSSGSWVSLTYTNGSARFFLVRRNSTDAAGLDGETVTVDGHEATLRDGPESGHVVTWTCGGKRYTVAGGLSEDATLSVAASIDCG